MPSSSSKGRLNLFFSAIAGSVLLKVKSTYLAFYGSTIVLNESFLSDLKKRLDETQRQLTPLGSTPFLEVSKQLVVLLQSIIMMGQDLNLANIVELMPKEDEEREIQIQFFGIEFNLSARQQVVLLNIFQDVDVSNQELKKVAKIFLTNALQLVPLTDDEKQNIRSNCILSQPERTLLIDRYKIDQLRKPPTITLSLDEFLKDEHFNKVKQNLSPLEYNALPQWTQLNVDALTKVVYEKQEKEAVNKKTKVVIERIFDGAKAWFLELSDWMRPVIQGAAGQPNTAELNDAALKPILVQILAELNGVTAFSLVTKMLHDVSAKLQTCIGIKEKKVPKTFLQLGKEKLPEKIGGGQKEQAFKKYLFSCGFFTHDMAEVIDKNNEAAKKDIQSFFDDLGSGLNIFKIWMSLFQEADAVLGLAAEPQGSIDAVFFEKLNFLKKVFFKKNDVFVDAVDDPDLLPPTVEQSDDDLDSLKLKNFLSQDTELFGVVKKSVLSLYVLNENFKSFKKSLEWGENLDASLMDESGNEELCEEIKRAFKSEKEKQEKRIIFAQKIFTPCLGFLTQLIGHYAKMPITDESERSRANMRQTILSFSKRVSAIAESPILLDALVNGSQEKILLLFQGEMKSLLESLVKHSESEASAGIHTEILSEIAERLKKPDRVFVAPTENQDKNFWDIARASVSSLTSLNDYLYKRAQETRYWHFFAFKWRHRLKTTIDIYKEALELVRVKPGANPIEFESKKTEMVARLGWLQLNYGGVWIDKTFFKNKPDGSWERALSLLSLVVTAVWAGWNFISGLLFWRRNSFAQKLQDVQTQIKHLENQEHRRSALVEQFNIVLPALEGMSSDLAPHLNESFNAYFNGTQGQENIPDFKKRKEVLTQYHFLRKPTPLAAEGEAVVPEASNLDAHWSGLLKPKGNRPSLKEPKLVYGLRRLGLGF